MTLSFILGDTVYINRFYMIIVLIACLCIMLNNESLVGNWE